MNKAEINQEFLYKNFISHFRKFAAVSSDELQKLLSFFQFKHYNKKENLQKEGELCRHQYFVLKGCLRMFFINEKGVEQTTQFAIENWWLADFTAFQNQQPSSFFIQAVEACDVMIIDFNALEQLYIFLPQTEKYFRRVYQKAYAASQMRIKYHYDFSREELYHHFITNFPDFAQRIPQYLLASFLGFTPEYLSELRKKNLS